MIGDSERTRLLADKQRVTYLNYDKHSQQTRLGLAFPDLEHDRRFWGGYWQKTFDRLLTLEQAHHQFPGAKLLHIESDVILFCDFPFESYLSLDRLAWCQHRDSYDIASILYSPTRSHSEWLAFELIKLARDEPGTTDMAALNRLRKTDSGEHVLSLPRFSTDQTLFSNNDEERSADVFLFDGAQFGQWILGSDPRSHWGLGRNRLWSTEGVNPLEGYSISLDSQGVKIEVNGEQYGLANLHVHSKRLSAFLEDDSRSLGVALAKLGDPKIHYYFSASAFKTSLISKTKRWSRSMWSPAAWKRMLDKLRRHELT